jgi:NAD(P)-dependent dehydrogenase (short-subunit alcohol dehydrogenase family)
MKPSLRFQFGRLVSTPEIGRHFSNCRQGCNDGEQATFRQSRRRHHWGCPGPRSAYATFLADLGAKVVVNDLGISLTGDLDGSSPAEQAAAELCASGAEAIANGSDVGDPKQAHTLIDEALAAFGRIDILVTNAGIVSRGPFATTSAATFDAHLRVHLHGTFNTCRAVWPTMLKQRYGRVVTVTSAALFGMDNVASYASAKGGIWA